MGATSSPHPSIERWIFLDSLIVQLLGSPHGNPSFFTPGHRAPPGATPPAVAAECVGPAPNVACDARPSQEMDGELMLWPRCQNGYEHYIGIYGSFHKWGYPKSSIFLDGISPYKPSSYWDTPIYGNPHIGISLEILEIVQRENS